MTRRDASERLGRAARVAIESLEGRQLFASGPTAALSTSLMAFNAIASGYSGSAASPLQTLTVTNTGGSTLTFPAGGISVVNDPAVSTGDAGDFAVTNVASFPSSLQPGQSANLTIDFAAPSSGLHSAFLQVSSNDPANPVEKVALRGLGTTGTGGGNEPSLAAILREYEIPTIVGDGPNDANAFASTFYPATPDPSSQEVAMPRLVKAGSGPVTVQLLASFDVANQPSLRFGTYVPGDPNDKSELFTINQPDSQSVSPTAQGSTSFDPGSNEFGLYTVFPTFTDNGQPRVSYSEDALNTWDANVPRKVRFFPLENANGTVVPNAYVFAAEDNNIPYGNIQPYDSNDLVGIIRNVKAAPGAPNGAVLGLTNLDGAPSSTRLVFNRIQNHNPNDPATFTDTVHDTDTLQINNTGNQTLAITGLSLSDSTNWQIVNPPALPLNVAPGGTAAITVKFIAQTDPSHTDNQTNDTQTTNGLTPQQAGGVWNGTLTIASNDADRPTRTVQLAGYWQDMSENENEPSLQTIINSLYGYSTQIAGSQLPQYPNNGATPVYYGEEVASGLWNVADPTLPVSIRQLADYHTQYDPTTGSYPATTIGWYGAGNSGNIHILFQDQPGESQSLLPTINGSTTVPAAATLTPAGPFGWDIDGEFSQDNLNTADLSQGRSGHADRFYPVRDSSGNLVPNEWLMVMDYENTAYDNSDFQDNVYLVTNMRPQAQAPAPADAQATAAAVGVQVQWQPVSDGSLVGYNVYRSSSPTGTYTKLNASPITTASYLDVSAPQGVASYYRITAIDTSGESLGANVSATANATNATTTTLSPAGDAYVLDGSPTTNFGSAPDLQAKVSSAGYNHESYLTFDLSSLSGNLTGATLKLFGEMETAGPDYTVNVIPVAAGSWSESTVTWNTRPADGSPVLGSMTVSGTAGQWYTVDLTAYIQSQLAAGQTTISLALEGAGLASAGYADFNSREAVSNTPQLQLTTVPKTVAAGTAAFVKGDATTAGNWTGVYGADGYGIFDGPTSYPAYAQVTPSNQLAYVWAAPTADARAPQNSAGSSSRTAGCFYSAGGVGSSFSLDVNLTDGKSHPVALYLLDWDARGRSESVQITDASTGAVLDTQNVSSFTGGKYLVWNLSGHVKITVTCTAGLNAVATGLFFGPVPATASATASFVKSDTTTGGTWTGVYGTAGYSVFNVASSLPSYAQLSPSGQQSWTWASSTSDTRALQNGPSASARTASCYYTPGASGSSFTLDLNLTDGQSHTVALYLLDYDSLGRAETIQVSDAATGAVLDTRSASNFTGGQWLVWNLSGHVKFTITCTSGQNAVASGIFFNNPPATGGSAAASFVKADTSTSGTWTGAYGADGYSVFNQATSLPSYAQMTVTGQQTYTWAGPTSDPRALQDSPSNANRIAACDFTSGAAGSSFTIDLNLTDGKSHQVALYLLDWDARGRAETVQISDAATGAVLDTRTASNFTNGEYLAWNLTGHVKITITCTAGVNAVASGLFFG